MLTENGWPCGATDKHLTKNQGIPGSSLAKVVIFCLMLR